MADSIEQVVLNVQSVCPDADPNLVRLWVRDAGRRTMEARNWSWMYKRGQWVVPALEDQTTLACTVTVTEGSDEIEFTADVATEDMVGRQFRPSTSHPVYDITGCISSRKLLISPTWGGDTAAGLSFSIFQSRLTLPTDCAELISVTSPVNRWQLWLNVPQEVLDSNDPSRSRTSGNPCLLSPLDYSTIQSGNVRSAIRVVGVGNRPLSDGTFTGQADALFTIEVTTGGVGGSCVIRWRKDEGAWVTGITPSADVAYELSDGVTVQFSGITTYTVSDMFVVLALARSVTSVPRFELYPLNTTKLVLPFLYVARQPDLTDEGIAVPGALAQRTDILEEKAKEFAASWPGTEDRPNPYNQINRRDYHATNWFALTMELAKQDNNLFQRNILPAQQVPFAPWPFNRGGNLQEYDPWLNYPSDVSIY